LNKTVVALLLIAAAPLSTIATAQVSNVAAPVRVNGWGVPLTDVPPDPAIRYGRLPNGMKYAIRANATPKGTASIRLHFNFGSLVESDTERGLAHFIEHMTFNGTTHVPEGEMKKILERQGLAFGPDSNAFTNFESTMYVLELPKADAQRLDTALFLLRETASEVKFDPAAMDRERGVILSEKRSRENFTLRSMLADANFHVPLSTLPNRLPIGTDEVLKTATPDQIRNLYQRYYQPQNATLIVVGDVDPAAIEAKIREKFSDWTGKVPAGARPSRGRVDLSRAADFDSFTDPAIGTEAEITVFRPWEDPADTRAERRRSILRSVGNGILTRRLQQLANMPDAKIISGSARVGGSRDLAMESSISAAAPEGQWQAALSTIEQELRRATDFGFTASELRTQLADIAGGQKMAADQADTRTNQSLAAGILSVIDENEFVTTPQFRLDFFREVRPTITLDEVNAEFRRLWTGSPPLVFVTDKKPVQRAEIAAVLEGSRKVAVLPQKDSGRLRFAYDSFGSPGIVVADGRIADLGIRTVRFANNVRLNIKRTDFEKGAVRYSINLAGGQLAFPRDKAGLALMVNSMTSLAGLEKHSAEDLKQIMAGHGVRPGFNVLADSIVAAGRTIPRDLLLQMKLSAAFMTAPGYRPEAATRWNAMVPIVDRQATATPQGAFGSKISGILANDDPRFSLPSLATLSQRNLGEARTVLAPLLQSAPIEIGIVGDIDEAAAIAAVAETFGALPPRQATPPAYAEARHVDFRKSLSPVTFRHDGQEGQAIVAAAFKTDDDKDFRRVAGLSLLTGILKQELDDEVRETLGATYGVSVNSVTSDVYDRYGYVLVNALVAPAQIPAVEKALASVVDQVRSKPISDDQLSRVRNPILERIERDDRDNGYWLGVVDEAQTDGQRLARHRQRKAVIAAITPGDLQRLAEQYLVPAKALHVRVLPKESKLAERATQ